MIEPNLKIDQTPDLQVRSSQREGFDRRVVPYEEIHSISSEDFDRLVELVDPKPGDAILDAGAGYGAVTREILKRHPTKGLRFTLLDISEIQLRRAQTELLELSGQADELHLFQDSIVHPVMCPRESFDTVVAKMVVHEVPNRLQIYALRAMFELLRPGGRIVVWDVALDTQTQEFFQDVIREKDRLAGYNYMVRNRYFLRCDEWRNKFLGAGFKEVSQAYDVDYQLDTRKRLAHELGHSEKLLDAWHLTIRGLAGHLPHTVLSTLEYLDGKTSIRFRPPKAIYTAHKPD